MHWSVSDVSMRTPTAKLLKVPNHVGMRRSSMRMKKGKYVLCSHPRSSSFPIAKNLFDLAEYFHGKVGNFCSLRWSLHLYRVGSPRSMGCRTWYHSNSGVINLHEKERWLIMSSTIKLYVRIFGPISGSNSVTEGWFSQFWLSCSASRASSE